MPLPQLSTNNHAAPGAGCGGAAHSQASTSAPPPARGGDTVARGLREATPEQGPPPPHARSQRALRDARFTRVSERVRSQVSRESLTSGPGAAERPQTCSATANHGGGCGREALRLQPVVKVVPGLDAVLRAGSLNTGLALPFGRGPPAQRRTPRPAPPQPSLSAEGTRCCHRPHRDQLHLSSVQPHHNPRSTFPQTRRQHCPVPEGAAEGRPQPGGKPLSPGPAPSSRN